MFLANNEYYLSAIDMLKLRNAGWEYWFFTEALFFATEALFYHT